MLQITQIPFLEDAQKQQKKMSIDEWKIYELGYHVKPNFFVVKRLSKKVDTS